MKIGSTTLKQYKIDLIDLRNSCVRKRFDELKFEVKYPLMLSQSNDYPWYSLDDDTFMFAISRENSFSGAQFLENKPYKSIAYAVGLTVFKTYLKEIKKELFRYNGYELNKDKINSKQKLRILNQKLKIYIEYIDALDVSIKIDLDVIDRYINVQDNLINLGIEERFEGIGLFLRVIERAEGQYLSKNIDFLLRGQKFTNQLVDIVEGFSKKRERIIKVLDKYLEKTILNGDKFENYKNKEELEINRLHRINSFLFFLGMSFRKGSDGCFTITKYAHIFEKWKPLDEQIYDEKDLIKPIIRKNRDLSKKTVAIQVKSHQIRALWGKNTDEIYYAEMEFLINAYNNFKKENNYPTFFEKLSLKKTVNKKRITTFELKCVVEAEYIEDANDFLMKSVSEVLDIVKAKNSKSFQIMCDEMKNLEAETIRKKREHLLTIKIKENESNIMKKEYKAKKI